MHVKISKSDFLQDSQGRRFVDVVNDSRASFQLLLDFFNDPDRQRRMIESEQWHKRPALAGTVIELETVFHSFLSAHDAHSTQRWRQAVGVLCRMIMQQLGWQTTGRKGPLGRREKRVPPGTTTPEAYVNTAESLSRYFTKAEHYTRP